MQIQRVEIEQRKRLVELLNKRKKIITINDDGLSIYEKNERDILVVKTDFELAKIHSSIQQKELTYKDYLDNSLRWLKEIETDWDKLIEKATKLARNNNDTIKQLLALRDDKKFEENWEHKIWFYVELKKLVYPNRDNKPKDLSIVK
jgi:hypothetical protein